MVINNIDKSLNKIAKISGFAFLFIVIGATLNWSLIFSKLIIPENVAATVNNIKDNQMLFRIGILYDLLMSLCGLVLAWSLYVMLKPVNKNLALFSFSLRMTEAILSAIPIIFCYIALQIVNGGTYLTVFNQEQLNALVGLFLNVRTPIYTIPMLFTGLGSIFFFYLLLKSKYVPSILAGFGIFSYIPLFIYVFIKIIVPQASTNMMSNIELIFYFPSVIFEIIIGFWLIFKGINTTKNNSL